MRIFRYLVYPLGLRFPLLKSCYNPTWILPVHHLHCIPYYVNINMYIHTFIPCSCEKTTPPHRQTACSAATSTTATYPCGGRTMHPHHISGGTSPGCVTAKATERQNWCRQNWCRAAAALLGSVVCVKVPPAPHHGRNDALKTLKLRWGSGGFDKRHVHRLFNHTYRRIRNSSTRCVLYDLPPAHVFLVCEGVGTGSKCECK